MTEVWVTIAVLTVATAADPRGGARAARRPRSARRAFQGVIALVAPALLAALVVVETRGRSGGRLARPRRPGLGVGAAARSRSAPARRTLPVVALAAVVTALVRALV